MPSASDTHDTRTQGRPGAAPAVFSPRGGLHEAPLARGLGAHGARPPAKDLGPAVDRMLAESGTEKPAPAPPVADEPAAKEMQSLDQQLAKAADDLMAGETAAEAAPPTAPVDEAAALAAAMGAPVAAAAAAAPGEPVADAEQRRLMELAQSAVRPHPPAAPAQPHTAPKPVVPAPEASKPAPAPTPAPLPPPKPAAPAKPAEATVLPPPPAPGATPPGGTAGAQKAARPPLARRLARAILEGLSSPLKNQPQYIRDTVGWVALVHIFMAACVWVYIVAIRSPAAAEPSVAVTPAAAESAEHGTPAKAAHKTPVKRSNPKNAPTKEKDAHASAAH